MGLLLFVSNDLATACREAGQFLAFRRRRAHSEAPDDHVIGISIHRGRVLEAPSRLTLQRPAGETFDCAVTESFGLPGLWEFGRLESFEGRTGDCGAWLSRNALPDALLSFPRSRDARETAGLYAPIFRRGTPKAKINDELRRLHARYPLRIAGPVFHDADTGLLFLDQG